MLSFILWCFINFRMADHIFLSFVEEDLDRVNLFRGQAKNANLEFDDYSVKEPINSENAPYIKQEIKKKITKSSIVLCLIGSSTHKSSWVEWELETGCELNKCLIGVRLNSGSHDIEPEPLVDHSVVDWKIKDIVDAIEECSETDS